MLNGTVEIRMALMSHIFCKTLYPGRQTTGTVCKGRLREVMLSCLLASSPKAQKQG